MMEWPYDFRVDPPCPVLPARIYPLASERVLSFTLRVDSGSDLTLIPSDILAKAGARRIDVVQAEDFEGNEIELVRYQVTLEISDLLLRHLRVGALPTGREALLGRDVLNRFVLTLDGPSKRMSKTL